MQIRKTNRGVLIATLMFLGVASQAHAYGPEGLFGGRPKPDGAIVLANPVDLRNERPERTEHVLDYPRPDYDAVPYEMGGFELYPTLEIGSAYDSNIFILDANEKEDAVSTVRPIVNLFSNWGRHAISLTTFGDVNFYSQHPDENYKNLIMDASGRYDISNQVWINGRVGYQRLAEYRTSPNDAGGSEPTTYGLTAAGVTFYHGVGLLKLDTGYDYKRFVYDNTPSSGGPIDLSGRDRDEHYFGGRLAYEISANTRPYVRAQYNVRDYDVNPVRDSDGWEAVVGLEADLGGITSFDVFAGWMQQYHDDFPVKKTVNSPRIGARVDWNVTGLTSLVFEADRTLEEVVLADYNSYFQTGASVTVTHELLRNLLVEGSGSYSHFDFVGSGDREDELMSLGTGFRYLINRSLYADVSYNWDKRVSDEAGEDYKRHMLIGRVGVHF